MSAAAQFIQLHARLTLDSRRPFITLASTRDSADIEATPYGKAWLDDYARYLTLWTGIVREGANPELLLHEQFGYVMNDETAVARSRRSPRPVTRLARRRRRR